MDIQKYPTPIAQALKNIEIQQHQKKVSAICNAIEDTIVFLGSLSVAFYRDSSYQNRGIDHLIFTALERPFIGNWLYIMQYIGKNCFEELETITQDKSWREFLRECSCATSEIKKQLSQLLEFRNDVRHGSASLNPNFVENIETVLFSLLQKLTFLRENELQTIIENNRVSLTGTKENIEIQSSCDLYWKNVDEIQLSPLLQCVGSCGELRFQAAEVRKSNALEFYQAMRMEKQFQEFSQEKQGNIKNEPASQSKHWKISGFSETLEKSQKLVICGFPGTGKKNLLEHLDVYTSIDQKFIIRYDCSSILTINPAIALKSLHKNLSWQINSQDCQSSKVIEESLQQINTLLKTTQQQFIFAIHGLFSLETPEWFDNYQEAWWQILNYSFHTNLKIVVTANTGATIPKFYDTLFSMPPVAKSDFIQDFSASEEQDCLYENSQGNAKILHCYVVSHTLNGSPTPKLPNAMCRYFQKIIRSLELHQDWQKKALEHLAGSSMSAKELAEKLQCFTPQIEKFLYKMSLILCKDYQNYSFYHPLFALYIKENGCN